MDEPRNTRRNLVVVAAVVGLFVSAAGVVALAQGGEGEVFTGCLNQNSGVLKKVAIGSEPAKPCNTQEVQITWDHAGPAFEGRIAELEARVAELEEPFGTLDLFVDCDAGDSIGAALDEARDHPGPVQVAVSGVCEEDVTIDRNDVHLRGVSPESGVRAASPDGVAVFLQSGRDVSLNNMTISGGQAGVFTKPGSYFEAHGLTVRDSQNGINVAGSIADLYDCTIKDNTSFGLLATTGSSVSIGDCLVTGNLVGLSFNTGSSLRGSAHITGNERGVAAQSGGTVNLSGSTIDQNVLGVSVIQNGTALIRFDSRVADNVSDGVSVRTGGVFTLVGSVVEGNGGYGISAEAASTVAIEGTSAIRSNTKDGIVLQDQSNGVEGISTPTGLTEISDNGGYGINCAGPPTIAPVQNQFNMANIQFSGNTNGDTNCP